MSIELFDSQERQYVVSAFDLLTKEYEGLTLQSQSNHSEEILRLIARGRRIVDRGFLNPDDMDQFNPATKPQVGDGSHSIDLSSSCVTPSELRHRVIHILRQALVFSGLSQSNRDLLIRLKDIENQNDKEITVQTDTLAFIEAISLSRAFRILLRVRDLDLLELDQLEMIEHFYSGERRKLAAEFVAQIKYSSGDHELGSSALSTTRGKLLLSELRLRREGLRQRLIRIVPYKLDNSFTFPWDTIREFEAHNPLMMGFEVTGLDEKKAFLNSSFLDEFMLKYPILSEKDIIWVILTVPPTQNITLALKTLAELKTQLLELQIPASFIEGYISTTAFMNWRFSMLKTQWEEAQRVCSPEHFGIMAKYVTPAHRSEDGYRNIGIFLSAQLRNGYESEMLVKVLNVLPPQKWIDKEIIAQLIAGYGQIVDMAKKGAIPTQPDNMYRMWAHIDEVRKVENIPERFMYAFLDVVQPRYWNDLFLVMWNMVYYQWHIQFPSFQRPSDIPLLDE